ncbi:hypothetical protein AB0912_09345 [Streptomyces sp. NPDC007084]|uniref:hypothetical protein n=1 Tax=Streptomyces sp. NPDC007084 TaxID=3154313 RepID=UPI00345541AB
MTDETEKRGCSWCKQEKPRAAFARNKSMPDGLQVCCRECSAEYYRQRQEAKGRTVRAKVRPGELPP